jgi:hypothetical protein
VLLLNFQITIQFVLKNFKIKELSGLVFWNEIIIKKTIGFGYVKTIKDLAIVYFIHYS